MSHLDEVGSRDGWRCWVCDEPVDPDRSVNDDRGPSVDSGASLMKTGKGNRAASTKGGRAASDKESGERLAHRSCNSRKGAVAVAVPWPPELFVSDPAPLIGVAERLSRKGGREVVARCPSRSDADEAAAWLVDRFSRLTPGLAVTTIVQPGGGQFMVAVSTQ